MAATVSQNSKGAVPEALRNGGIGIADMAFPDMAGTFSGREITAEDMEIVRWARAAYPGLSRHELAGTVCELIGWVTPAGVAKTPQCMAFFAKMEADGKLDLPVLKARKPALPRGQPANSTAPAPEITKCGSIELCIARPGADLRKWRGYISNFHRLGDKMVFGSRLHYFIRSDGVDLGCLQFSAAAWSLDPRDRWIGWSADDRKARLFLVANNSRFLILPNVRIKNLASRALSLAVRQLPGDWERDFGYAPVLLETFVDTAYYKGVSYKASNWILLGHSKGRGRMDSRHDSRLSPKAVFVYPLRPDFADVLKGVKSHKTTPLL